MEFVLNEYCQRIFIWKLFRITDDLDISPDFYEYFAATYLILHRDPTLWCVSAWNDNGKGDLVENSPGAYYCAALLT